MQDLIPKEKRLSMARSSVYNLWREWLYSFGSISLCVLLSFLIPKLALPAIVLILGWLLSRFVSNKRNANVFKCVRVTSLTATILTITALIMIICLIVNKTELLANIIPLEARNPQIPYVTALIVFPVAALVMGFGMLTHGKTRHCHECKLRLGCTPEDNFVGNIFHREAFFQLRLMFWISVTLTLINTAYYLTYYSNASINGRDKYFFLILPLLAFGVSLFYTGSRYRSIIDALTDIYNNPSRADSVTVLRYLIIRGDTLLVDDVQPTNASECSRLDTPAVEDIPYVSRVTDKEASERFEKMSGAKSADYTLRPLYNNMSSNGKSNAFHYVVIMKDDTILPSGWKYQGIWSSLDQIDRLWKAKAITPMLAAEIHRIFTVTMAWKTYDDRGFRRYPIKNYHPTFRLRDFKDWDVDYSDPVWISVATNNQDRPMFRMRKLLAKLQGK